MPRGLQPAPVKLHKLRDLDLAVSTAPGRPRFLSAASGLVLCGDGLYVVADDELHLGCFSRSGSQPGTLLRLFPGDLPGDRELRRKRKPDLEILLRLPPSPWCGHGALLALGSGSRKQRCRGALLPLDAQGAPGAPIEIDAAPLFLKLGNEFGALNLEGGWISGSRMWLLQRGNKADSTNALVGIALEPLLDCLHRERVLPPVEASLVRSFDLGSRDGVPLCFTDGCALPDGDWLFCAVAEDTLDPGVDGEFVGAVIGRVSARHELQWQRAVSPQYKLEGINAVAVGAGLRLLLVADADDPKIPSSLLSASID